MFSCYYYLDANYEGNKDDSIKRFFVEFLYHSTPCKYNYEHHSKRVKVNSIILLC